MFKVGYRDKDEYNLIRVLYNIVIIIKWENKQNTINVFMIGREKLNYLARLVWLT